MGNVGELGRRIGKRLLNFILVVWGVVTVARHAKRYYFVSQKVAVKSLGPYG